MKNMKTTILTAALVILMAVANAGTYPDTVYNAIPKHEIFRVSIIHPSAEIINFRVANPGADKVVLKIYNDRNVKIFHRTIKKNIEMSIKCDMSNCKDGTYTCVVLRNGVEEIKKEITLN
jgi:hypothetical protein